MHNKFQEFAFPLQKDIQIAYGLSENPDLNEGRRTFDICYELEKVFDSSFYKNGKRFKKHVRTYLKYFEDNKFYIEELRTVSHVSQMWDVFNEWNDRKIQADIENPNHYREHSERYRKCLEKIHCGELKNSKIFGMFDSKGVLISYQLATFNKDWAFGITTACRKTDYEHIANVATINFLKFFKDLDYKYCNWGECGGDKKLIEYKEAYPSFRIYYGKLAVEIERSSEKDEKEIINLMQKVSTPEIPFPTDYMPDSIDAGHVWKALLDEKLVGMVECRMLNCKYFMTNLIVDSDYRNLGIATKLLDKLNEDLGSDYEFECYKVNEKANKFYRNLPRVTLLGETKNDVGESWKYRRNFL